MKRSDSILQQFYMSKLPKAQIGRVNIVDRTGDIASLPGVQKQILLSKEELAKNKQAVEQRVAANNAKILADRKTRLAGAAKANATPYRSLQTMPQQLADESQATADKFRFFPNDPNSFIDDYLNPGVLIGNLASGLGRVPLNLQQGNYGQAAMNVAMPLVTGAFAGLGTKNTGQFVNNLVNPVSGIEVPSAISSSLNKLGLDKVSSTVNKLIGKELNKKLPLSTPISTRALAADATITEEGNRILNRLDSPEGRRRLTNQFKIADPSLNDEQLNYLVNSRLSEVNTAVNYNHPRYYLDFGRGKPGTPTQNVPFTEFLPRDNAFFTEINLHPKIRNYDAPAHLFPPKTTLPSSPNISSGRFNLSKPTIEEHLKAFANPAYRPGSLALGTGLELNKNVAAHEVMHAIQNKGMTPVDVELLKLLQPKNTADQLFRAGVRLSPELKENLRYFTLSGGRAAKTEPYAFLEELRNRMLNTGIIKNDYEKITPWKLAKARLDAVRQVGRNFEEGTRLIKFTPPWKYGKLADIMNIAPAAIPVVGAAALLGDEEQSPMQKNGGPIIGPHGNSILPKAQLGLKYGKTEQETRDAIIKKAEEVFNSGKKPYKVPDKITQGSYLTGRKVCIQGVCGILSDAGFIPEDYYTNTSFAEKASDFGFGYPVTDITRLKPGDVFQHFTNKNAQGNYYPGHAEIFKRWNDKGEAEFYDYYDYYNYPSGLSSGIRTYERDELAERLKRRAEKDNSGKQAQFFSVAGNFIVPKQFPYNLPQNELQQHFDKTHASNVTYSSSPSAIENTSPLYYTSGEDVRQGTKDALVNAFNDKDLDSQLKKNLRITDQELQKIKPLVYGIVGQETNYGNPKSLKGNLKYALENLLQLDNTSLGPGQIKLGSLSKDVRQNFNINKNKDLLDPRNTYIGLVDILTKAANITDKHIDAGKHPELIDKDRYERALYFVNSPGKVRKTDEELKEQSLKNSSWMSRFSEKRMENNIRRAENAGLRMDDTSYPAKVVNKSMMLDRDIDFEDEGILPEVRVSVKKKETGGVIVDPRGQWAHPGKVTRIPGSSITMRGVPYPLYAKPNKGQGKMIYPGENHEFPKADYVDEYPMIQKGLIAKMQNAGQVPQGTQNAMDEGAAWLQNWYKQRMQRPQFKDVAEKRYNALSQKPGTVVNDKELARDRSEAAYDPVKNRFVIPSQDTPGSTDPDIWAHEFNHYARFKAPQDFDRKWVKGYTDNFLNSREVNKKYNMPISSFTYLRDPYETEAFLTAFRKDAQLDPNKSYSREEMLDKMKPYMGSPEYEDIRKQPYDQQKQHTIKRFLQMVDNDPEKLLYLHNGIVGNDRAPMVPMAKNGGQHGGLDRWFAEKWVDVKSGKPCGRQEGESRAYPACRPSKRISSQTPKTSSEMSPAEKAKFKRTKTSSERIPYNHKRN